MAEKIYKSFKEFYPFYLTEHSNLVNRWLHFSGTTLVILTFILALATQHFSWLWFMPLFGYSFAWVGHFFVEKNRPATFKYPLWSLGSDFVMYWHIITGQLDKRLEEAKKTING